MCDNNYMQSALHEAIPNLLFCWTDAHMLYLYLNEHLWDTETTQHIEIVEVVTDVFIVDGNVSSYQMHIAENPIKI